MLASISFRSDTANAFFLGSDILNVVLSQNTCEHSKTLMILILQLTQRNFFREGIMSLNYISVIM